MGPIRRGTTITGALLLTQDVTETKTAQQELFAAQRLAAIGTLAAGIAHEINTPVQFLGDNIEFLSETSEQLFSVLELHQALRALVASNDNAAGSLAAAQAAQSAEEQADLEYLRIEVPKAFEGCREGLQRVSSIVRSMKEFSHPADLEMAPVELNRAIEATLTVARSEYKYVADLETDLGELPAVTCYVNDINQVVLNIVVNAAHAIADKIAGTGQRGLIRVSTRRDGSDVVIAIADNGPGIPVAIRERIFEPFFTTKEVGRGTGQGLALAWSAVKEKHAGELTFDTRLGEGTTFYIRLPICGASSSARSATRPAGSRSS
jgi:signal transduction histidine kinase